MDNDNAITGRTGSAVKIRHCPATVKDEHLLSITTALSGKVTVDVLSQETGPVRNQEHFRGGGYETHSYWLSAVSLRFRHSPGALSRPLPAPSPIRWAPSFPAQPSSWCKAAKTSAPPRPTLAGKFQFNVDSTGRYSVRAEAKTFAPPAAKKCLPSRATASTSA